MINYREKSWLPLVILISVLLVFAVAFFGFNNFDVRSPTEPEPGCVVMSDRGNYENSIDIVFLPENYDSVLEFVEDSERMMDAFLEIIPYAEYSDRFNFFRIENFEDLGCDYENDAAVCDPAKVKKEALLCPFDYPIVLVDVKGIRNFFQHLRSSAWRGVASLNSKDDPLVFPHEFGHLFVDLLDEYTWPGGKIIFAGPNCDPQSGTCPKFQMVDGSECHIGCVNNDNARSIYTGIMKDYWISNRYGVFNEYIIEEKILHNSLSKDQLGFSSVQTSGPPKLSPQDSILVSYSCSSSTNCKITEVEDSYAHVSNILVSDNHIHLLDPEDQFEIIFEVGEEKIHKFLTFYAHTEGYDIETGQMVAEDIFYDSLSDILIIDKPKKQVAINLNDARGNLLFSYDYIPSFDNDNSFSSSGYNKQIEIGVVQKS